MCPSELSGPDLAGVVGDADDAGLENVVIGGFSVIYHGFVRATRDSDLLVPDGPDADAALLRFLKRTEARRLPDDKPLTTKDVSEAEHLRVNTRHGLVDIVRGGAPPLDFDTVAQRAVTTEWHGRTVRIAALPSVVGFKRLAGRPQDKLDLTELEAIHGNLPTDPIPGLDT
jgi:hypothetical protein